jgi:hypothetical protein
VFDRGTIVEVCVSIRGKGTAELWEEESDTWSCSRPAVGGWLAGDVAAGGESMGKKKLGPAAKLQREKRVLTAEGSDTKLRNN